MIPAFSRPDSILLICSLRVLFSVMMESTRLMATEALEPEGLLLNEGIVVLGPVVGCS